MDGRSLGEIIESIATRTDSETHSFARLLLGRSWPGEASDRHDPGAREWVRRWGPIGPVPLLPGCSCAAGRCDVCN